MAPPRLSADGRPALSPRVQHTCSLTSEGSWLALNARPTGARNLPLVIVGKGLHFLRAWPRGGRVALPAQRARSGREGRLSLAPSRWNPTLRSGLRPLQAPASFEDRILRPPAWWSGAQSRSLLGVASMYVTVPLRPRWGAPLGGALQGGDMPTSCLLSTVCGLLGDLMPGEQFVMETRTTRKPPV